MIAGRKRWDSVAPFAVVGVAVGVGLALFLIRIGGSISDDGAVVVAARWPLTFDGLMTPYHEHWNAVPLALWWAAGLHWPVLMGMLAASHAALAGGAMLALLNRLGPAAGIGLGLPLLVLGSAAYDLLMPFQILFTIPLLCGLLIVVRPQPAVVVPAALIAVASSGAGLFLLGAIGLWWTLEGRMREVWILMPAVFAWTIWFAIYGHTGLGDDGLARVNLAVIPGYVGVGLSTAAGGLLGVPASIGAIGLTVSVGAAALSRWRPTRAVIAFGLAVVAMYAVAGLFRSYGGVEQAMAGRYVYLAGFFLAFALIADPPRVRRSQLILAEGLVSSALNVVALAVALPSYK